MASMDRRIYTRYQVRIEALVTTQKCSYSAEITEISLVGARMNSLQAINPGTKVTIRIELRERIVFHGKVIWALGTFNNYLQNYIIGIETDSMEFADIKAIGLTERAELLQEILLGIKEKAVSAIV